MPRGPVFRPGVTDDTGLAQARERFLTAESVEPGRVRDTILASWRRCRQWHVAADRIDLCYVRDPDLDTPLTRNALPVLQNLHENLEGQPISVILTDAHGVALSRLTADHDLERHLDSVQLAPGFSYAEEFVGTNGIGTALESGQGALIGHAAEALAGDHLGPVDAELPTGASARMYCRPLRGKGGRRLVGGVVAVKLLELDNRPAAHGGAGSQARRFGPGLVGSGPL